MAPGWTTKGLSDSTFAWGATLAAAVAVAVLVTGTHISARLIYARRDRLGAVLSEPDRG
jgi:hypothetical protein